MLKIISVPRSEIRCATILSKKHFSVKAILHSSILFFCMVGILEPSPARAQQSKLDSLLRTLEKTNVDTSRVNLHHEISIEYIYTDFVKAKDYARQGIELAKGIKDKKGQQNCTNSLGRAFYQAGELDSAMFYYEKRLIIAQELNDSIGIASSYLNKATIYYRQNDLDKALDLNEKARKIYTSYGKNVLLAKAYNNIGAIYCIKGDYLKEIDYYIKALKLYEQERYDGEVVLTMVNVALAYRRLNQTDNALKYVLEAQHISEKKNNIVGKAYCLQILAEIYQVKGDYNTAISHLKDANDCYVKLNDRNSQGLTFYHLGSIYYCIKRHREAIESYGKAISIFKNTNQSMYLYSIGEMGFPYIKLHDYQKAIKCFRKMDESHLSSEISMYKQMCKGFIEVYSHINQPDSVAKYFAKYEALADSSYSEQSAKAIAEMQTRYETEKKDKEILSLNLEAQKRKNTVWAITSGFGFLLVLSGSGFAIFRNRKKKEQAELQQQVTEHDVKALRAQMNPHFIFNRIHSIDSLLDEQKTQESKECLVKFSALTRSVLENSDRREIPLSEEVRILGLYMDLENTRFAVPFAYELNIATEIDGEVTFIPPLILQPFVENSIKHGFSKETGGHLKIDIHKNENSLICIIEDNGCGRNIGSNGKGLLGTKSKSMGLRLSEDRLKLISLRKHVDAYFEIEDLTDSNNNPAGTRVKLTLPFEQLI